MKGGKLLRCKKKTDGILNLSLGLLHGKGIYLLNTTTRIRDFPVGAVVRKPPASAGDARDLVSIPGSGRCPGGGDGSPLQFSCLEAQQATVRGVSKSWTQLSN